MRVEIDSELNHQDEHFKGVKFETVRHNEDNIWIQIGNQEVMVLKSELKQVLSALV